MASREVLLDTSALYALIDKRDAHHVPAREAVGRLIAAQRSLLTSDYIVTEAVNLGNARGGTHVALRILELLERSVGIRMEWIGSERFGRAVAFFRRHADHRYSLTDCSSFILMRELELTEAVTTDHHFTEAGFRVLVGAA